MKNQRKKLEAKLDKLIREYCFTRDNFTCQRTGVRQSSFVDIDPHHVDRKRAKVFRWNPYNVITLAQFTAHRKAHDDEKEFLDWFKNKYPERQKMIDQIDKNFRFGIQDLENHVKLLKDLIADLKKSSASGCLGFSFESENSFLGFDIAREGKEK